VTRAYAFIDGASFERNAGPILAQYESPIEELNWQALTRNAERIFYFDALPTKKNNQTDEDFQTQLSNKQQFFSRLRRVPNMHVREGITRFRQGSGKPLLQQKGVDIALAVEVLRHAHSGNMDVARIFANDADFYPLLDALTSTKVRSELYFSANAVSTELVEAADMAEELNHYTLHTSLPEAQRQKYTISGHAEDISHYSRRLLGEANFGPVYVLERPTEPKLYVLEGPYQDSNLYSHMSASLELLIGHYEAIIKSKIVLPQY
jgi:uncharacterized LabA/DUF88 family protein